MMKRLFLFFFVTLFCVSISTPAQAGYFDRIEVGARGLALAGAYGASVDDVSALHWNPAGLSLMQSPEIMLTHSRPYVVRSLSTNAVAVGAPILSGGVALGWHRLGVTDLIGENLISLGYGQSIYTGDNSRIYVGGAAKLASVSISIPGRDFGTETKVTADLGLMVQQGRQLRLGLVHRNFGEPSFDFIEGGESTQMPASFEFAASYHWRPESVIHLSRSEVAGESAWNYSGEIWFYEVFAIRAGVFDEEFSGGFGLQGDQWNVDGAFLTHDSLGNTYRMSVRFFLEPGGGN
ncbi:MAG: conjugal transfer protein TraF [Candidatus Eisenbacteria bacterium]|uniref:Conjugal transfer protein TraF n=1 Tax=Eiseniibacteriota bacterium TaxID=2212470 RepID=A0A7Y2H3L4_UNCEI|nr:conjugal transfer protein TraF [Candidatus Eisenbacteria bacterium]